MRQHFGRALAAAAAILLVVACEPVLVGPEDPLTEVTIDPHPVVVEEQGTVQLQVTLTDTDGPVENAPAIFWSSENRSIAQVSPTGVVTGVTAGTTRIAASAQGVSGLVDVTVLARGVDSVSVAPAQLDLFVGGNAPLQATAYDRSRRVMTGQTVTWETDSPGVATVDGQGVVTAVGEGTAKVSAVISGKRASTNVNVTRRPVATVEINPPLATLVVGGVQTFVATARDAQGGIIQGRPVFWSSTNPAVATVSQAGVVQALAPGATQISALIDGKTGTSNVSVSVTPIAAVEISPSRTEVNPGQNRQLVATAKAPDGSELRNRIIVWRSSNPAVVSVDAQGMLEARSIGTTSITATSEGKTGSAEVVVQPVPVAQVLVSPGSSSIVVGSTQQFSATTRAADGTDLPGRAVSWSSGNSSIATVSASGLVTAVAPGSTTISAASEGQTGTATVTVSLIPVASVAVTPTTSALFVGGTQQLSASTRAQDGSTLGGRTITWSSGNPGAATVSSTGLVTAVAPGNAMITASSEGQAGTALISVTLVPVASVTVTPGSASIVVGGTQQLTATPRSQNGTALTGRATSWSSSNSGVATVTAAGQVSAVAPGEATISAVVEGQTGTSTITVSPIPVASVGVTPGTASLLVGGSQQLTATPRSQTGDALTGRVIAWSTGNAGVATVSASGLVTAVAPGTTIVSATSEGQTGTSSVTVSPIPVASVAVSPGSASLFVGGSQQLTATPLSQGGTPLTGRLVTWSSSNTEIATVSSTGMVTAIATGSVTISAASEGQTGTSSVTVSLVPVAAVGVSPGSASIFVGGTQQLTATTTAQNGSPLSGRPVTWSSSNTAVATVSSSGLVTGITPGTVTITALSEGRTGTASITVSLVPVATVGVTPGSASVFVGGTQQMTVTLRDQNGVILSGRAVTWSSTNGGIALVNSSGLVTGIAPGTATITAFSEGRTGTSTVTVSLVPVAAVDVTPGSASIFVGATQQLTATPRSQNGTALNDRPVSWSSTNQAVATVSSTGLVTGVGPGSATISASSEGQSGISSITVALVPVAAVSVSPPTASLFVGGSQQLTATPTAQNGATLSGRAVTWSSSDNGIATVNSSGLVTGVAQGTATITATSEGRSGTSSITVSLVPVATVAVSPGSVSLFVGGTQQLNATPTAQNGAPLTGRSVSWSSGNAGVATVSSSGLVTAVGPGSTTISATSEGQTGTSTITVAVEPVASVAVSPGSASLFVGGTQQLNATPTAQNGAPLTGRSVTWTSGNTSVATVSSTGLVTGVAPGTVTITATSEGQAGTSSITVSLVPVASVPVTPGSASLFVGGTQQLTATPTAQNGTPLPDRSVSWSSNNASVATVSSTGLVTGIGPGTATITATSEGQTGTSTITVSLEPVASVAVSPGSASLFVGGTQQLTATATSQNGTPLTGRSVTWSTSDPLVAAVSSTGVVTGLLPGSATISATVEGQTGTSTITVSLLPVASVAVTPGSASLLVGETQQLTATPTSQNGTPLAGRSVSWSSGDSGVATVNGSGLVTAVAPGTATISATSEGQTGTSTITVTAAPVASVAVSPGSASIPVGGTQQLSATPMAQNGTPLTGRAVSWTSDNTGVATVNGSGLVTGVGPGTATISATSEGQTGTSSITVSAVPVASVGVSPGSASIFVGGTQQLSATPMAQDGTPLTGRAVSWTSDNTGVATVSGSGLVTGVAPGTATISATSEGQTGTSSITVSAEPVASVAVSPASASLIVGETQQLTATPTAQNGSPLTGRSVTWSSSDNNVAAVSSSGLVTAIGSGTATISATSEGQTGTSTITVSTVPVASVAVSPGSASLNVGDTQQLTATPTAQNGSPLNGRSVSWSSSDNNVATVNSSGLVTAVASGTATISATSEGQTGTATITVSTVPVASVAVSPGSASLNVGDTQQLTATPTAQNGSPLTGRSVSWSSSDNSVATVSSSGLVTALAPGTATISATSEGQIGTSVMTVSGLPVASVEVNPGSASLVVGGTQQLTATPRAQNGSALTGRVVSWSSSDSGVASVSTSGLVTGVGPGTATISAISEGQIGTSSVTVSAAPVASVAVSPGSASLSVGETRQLTATPAAQNGTPLTDRTVSWLSSDNAVATVSSSGLVTAIAPGTASISAASEGQVGTSTITVVAAPVASVEVSPGSPSIFVGGTQQLTATPKAQNGTPLTGRSISWSSSDTGVATVDGSGLVTGVAAGTATISAVSEGQTGTSTITVALIPVASVTVTPASATVAAGETQQLTATTKAQDGSTLSGRTVSWSTDNANVATVSPSGLVTPVAPGNATISATSEGQTGTAAITVPTPPLTPVSLVYVSGNNQTADNNQNLANPLVVRVVGLFGLPIPFVTVTWTAADGSANPATSQTGLDGTASTVWNIGPGGPGQRRLTATIAVTGVPGVQFTASRN